MTVIAGTTSTNNDLLNTTSQTASSADTVASQSVVSQNNDSADTNIAKPETVEISTRAQKIQKLNEEFFAAGPRAFKVTAEFIDRLQEYGLLSASAAKQLGGNTGANGEGAETVVELSLFIDSFVASVKQVAPDSTLIELLQQAQTVLDNFNNPTAESLAINIPVVTQQLKDYSDTSTDTLPEADRQSLKQLLLVLGAADVLNPGTNTTAEIDQYLAVKGE